MIRSALVNDEVGRTMFSFDLEDWGKNVNRLPLGGDPFDLRWVWPVESVIPSWRLGRLVHHRTGGHISWQDVAVLVARSENV
jgi:hypothetical protein